MGKDWLYRLRKGIDLQNYSHATLSLFDKEFNNFFKSHGTWWRGVYWPPFFILINRMNQQFNI